MGEGTSDVILNATIYLHRCQLCHHVPLTDYSFPLHILHCCSSNQSQETGVKNCVQLPVTFDTGCQSADKRRHTIFRLHHVCLSAMHIGVIPHIIMHVISRVSSISSTVLNMGTSCQLSFIANTDSTSHHLQRWPYKAGADLLVAASMNGGNVLTHFVGTLKSWMTELGKYYGSIVCEF